MAIYYNNKCCGTFLPIYTTVLKPVFTIHVLRKKDLRLINLNYHYMTNL